MDQATPSTASANTLHCALELGKKSWLLAIQFPDREQPSLYPIAGAEAEKLMAKLTQARDRERLRPSARPKELKEEIAPASTPVDDAHPAPAQPPAASASASGHRTCSALLGARVCLLVGIESLGATINSVKSTAGILEAVGLR
jgi:hypothetical protein